MEFSAYLEGKPRFEKAKGCFSLQTTCVTSFPSKNWVYFTCLTLQALCFASFVRLICEAYYLIIAMCCFAMFGKRSNFHTKTGVSRLEVTFGLACILLKPTAKPSAQRAFHSEEVPSGSLEERTRWEKCKSWFSLQTFIWAGVPSQNGVYFASRMLQASCFVLFVRLLAWDYHPSTVCAAFHGLGKGNIFLQKYASPERSIWIWFQSTEANCRNLMPTEL